MIGDAILERTIGQGLSTLMAATERQRISASGDCDVFFAISPNEAKAAKLVMTGAVEMNVTFRTERNSS